MNITPKKYTFQLSKYCNLCGKKSNSFSESTTCGDYLEHAVTLCIECGHADDWYYGKYASTEEDGLNASMTRESDEPYGGELLKSQVEKMIDDWIISPQWNKTEDCLPPTAKKVIAVFRNEYGKFRRIIAVRYEKFEREDDWNDSLDTEYDDITDHYYWPAGWYEQVECWDEYSEIFVPYDILLWAPLLEIPEEMMV